MKTQYAVFEKVPAHGSKPNGVILCSYNTKEEAQSAGEKYGYNTDNYYVGEYNWKLAMTQIPESIAKQPLDPNADYSEMGNVALDLVKKVFVELNDNKKRKPRTKSYDISFDGVHINGQPIHCNESPTIKKLEYRHSNGLCLGCGKKECQCKSKE